MSSADLAVRVLRDAAKGRREYAEGDGPWKDELLAIASAFESAASMIEKGTWLDFLRGTTPSWRWTELGIGLDAPVTYEGQEPSTRDRSET